LYGCIQLLNGNICSQAISITTGYLLPVQCRSSTLNHLPRLLLFQRTPLDICVDHRRSYQIRVLPQRKTYTYYALNSHRFQATRDGNDGRSHRHCIGFDACRPTRSRSTGITGMSSPSNRVESLTCRQCCHNQSTSLNKLPMATFPPRGLHQSLGLHNQ
jgi:hypothetical protein